MFQALVDLIRDIISNLASKPDAIDAARVAEVIANRLLPLLLAAIQAELNRQLSVIGFLVATSDLDAAARKVTEAMRVAETSPTVPRLDLDIELVKPEPLAAWPCGYDEPVVSNGAVALPSTWAGSYLSPDEARGFASRLVALADEAERTG